MPLLIVLGLAGALVQSPSTPTSAAIAGQVLESTSRTPIAGAEITLGRVVSRRRAIGPLDQPIIAITDRSGRYVFQGLEPGRYWLNVRKPGFASVIGAIPEFTLAPGEQRAGLDVLLQRGAVIPGRVIDENGEPLARMEVRALRKAAPFLRNSPPLRRGSLIPVEGGDQTNDLGEFRLFGLPPGEYYIQARPQLRFDGRLGGGVSTVLLPTYFPSTPEAVSAIPVTVEVGENAHPVEIRMITAPAFEISGVVTDEAGQPVGNAKISLSPDDTTDPRGPMTAGFHGTRTDVAGRFMLTGVTSGHYVLTAIAPVVTAVSPSRPGVAGDLSGSVSGSFSGGGITTETANGITVEYRETSGTRVPIIVSHANVSGLDVAVRRPSR